MEEVYNEGNKNMCHFGISKFLGIRLATLLEIHPLSRMAEAARVPAFVKLSGAATANTSEILIE